MESLNLANCINIEQKWGWPNKNDKPYDWALSGWRKALIIKNGHREKEIARVDWYEPQVTKVIFPKSRNNSIETAMQATGDAGQDASIN